VHVFILQYHLNQIFLNNLKMGRRIKRSVSYLLIFGLLVHKRNSVRGFSSIHGGMKDVSRHICSPARSRDALCVMGWVQDSSGEWEWEEDDPNYSPPVEVATMVTNFDQEESREAFVSAVPESQAAPKLPSGTFAPKQSLGQNFLQDGNTIIKIVKAFEKDAKETISNGINGVMIDSESPGIRAIELGPGAGALTGPLVATFGSEIQAIEIDPRSVELLGKTYPHLRVTHMDVMQVDYPLMAKEEGGPLSVVGNLPYYITSQILFALADASHFGAVRSATVTMQWEVAQRIVASTKTKDYGILSVVFQLYADCQLHFKIPPTVFYPKPKVDSALIGLRFIGPDALRRRLAGVSPTNLRRVVTTTFQQRRKTVRNTLKKIAIEICGGDKDAANELLSKKPVLPKSVMDAQKRGDRFAMTQSLPDDWLRMRPEELSAGQFVEITRLLFGSTDELGLEFERKVWRKLKHGSNE